MVPAVNAWAVPPTDIIEATAVLDEVHVPPPTTSVSTKVQPGQTDNVPAIGDGTRLFVISPVT